MSLHQSKLCDVVCGREIIFCTVSFNVAPQEEPFAVAMRSEFSGRDGSNADLIVNFKSSQIVGGEIVIRAVDTS